MINVDFAVRTYALQFAEERAVENSLCVGAPSHLVLSVIGAISNITASDFLRAVHQTLLLLNRKDSLAGQASGIVLCNKTNESVILLGPA